VLAKGDCYVIEPGPFRRALGSFPTGVAIVTAIADGEPAGMTINSFSSVSLTPPLVQFSVDRKAHSLAVWQAADHFAIHVLAEKQIDLSNRFAKPRSDKWADMSVSDGLGGTPLIKNALCIFECSKWAEYDGGDHLIFIGQVEQIAHNERDGRAPLVFHGGNYRRLAEKTGSMTSAEDALLMYGW
jgi:flavin reductase (DIM6/NTAB) family NADH-FMN oxidoreductase RutF